MKSAASRSILLTCRDEPRQYSSNNEGMATALTGRI